MLGPAWVAEAPFVWAAILVVVVVMSWGFGILVIGEGRILEEVLLLELGMLRVQKDCFLCCHFG
jgi:hypothetical protein